MVNTDEMEEWAQEIHQRIAKQPGLKAHFAEPDFQHIFELIFTLNETTAILHEIKHNQITGRTGYPGEVILRIIIMMFLTGTYQMAKFLRILKITPLYQKYCQIRKEIPCESTLSRGYNRITKSSLISVLQASINYLYSTLPPIKEDVLIDGTNFWTNANPSKGTDLEAGWQIKNTAPPAFGYQLMTMTSSQTGLIIGVNLQGKHASEEKNFQEMVSQGNYVLPPNARFLLGDAKFDDKKTYDCVKNGLHLIPIIDYNPRQSPLKEISQLPDTNWRFQYCPKDFPARSLLYKYLRGRVETPFNKVKPEGYYVRFNVRGLEKNWIRILFFCISYNLTKIVAHTLPVPEGPLVQWYREYEGLQIVNSYFDSFYFESHPLILPPLATTKRVDVMITR